jgi:hypothetical protein
VALACRGVLLAQLDDVDAALDGRRDGGFGASFVEVALRDEVGSQTIHWLYDLVVVGV